MDTVTLRTKTLEALKFAVSHRISEREMMMSETQLLSYVDYLAGYLVVSLAAYVYAGEKRERIETVEFKRPATWLDALQIHAQSKGELCGGGLLGLLLYWWFLDREPRYVSERRSCTFRARELFPDLRSNGPRCVITDMTESNPWSAR